MAEPLHALIVEDNELDALLLLRELRRAYDVTHLRVETAEAMEAALTTGTWDIVLSDFSLPHFGAPQALKLIKKLRLDIPFIILSGTIGEEAAVEAMRAGAQDFVAKGHLTRLLPAIDRELRDAAGRAERKTIEQQLRRAQKMDALGQLTGGIAHDFNNLLGVIVANTELLLEDVQGKPELAGLAELANEVLSSALRGADLTHRLLAVARRQPLSPSRIDLNEKLPAIVAMLQRTLGEAIHVVASLGEGLWPVQIDPSQAEDALLNLAINARDAMPSGGTLVIETANVVLDEHYAAQHPGVVAGDYAVLSVTDTGVGMPPEIVERAIEPFFTTKGEGKGSGLGLAMVYGFVKQSNGHFSIYSQVGVGTTIKLYLPRADIENVGADKAEPDQAVAVSGHERLLVVDDNPALLKVATRQLSQLGYDIETAESGHGALELLKSGRRFSLLFTDLGLPEGMSGYDLAALAKQYQPWIKVLFTTGYARVGRRQDDNLPATDTVLRKPYRGKELAAQVRALLDS